MRAMLAIIVCAGAVLAAPALALAQTARPLAHTDFSIDPDNPDDAHWNQVFVNEREVLAHGEAFAAHFTIQRPAMREEFAALYIARLCAPFAEPYAAVAKCPSRLLLYRDGAKVEGYQAADVCLLHFGSKPPAGRDAGWSGPQAAIRLNDGKPVLVMSALLHGELVPDCTVSIPLDPRN